jgi:hypothetical protein
LVIDLTKRNAFKGGEKLNLKLNGSYEWQTGKSVQGNSSLINSYDYGGSISIDYPRLELPWNKRYRLYSIPSTSFSIAADCMNRADYFKMTTVSAGVTYKFQTSATSKHEISPFLLDFEILQNKTARFDSIINANPALYVSMRNQFIPKMKYTYTYTSPLKYKNPIVWESSVTESGNILSLSYVAVGQKFNEKGKNLFGNPYAQFLKITTDLRKTWTITDSVTEQIFALFVKFLANSHIRQRQDITRLCDRRLPYNWVLIFQRTSVGIGILHLWNKLVAH